MTLFEAQKEKEYKIKNLFTEVEITRRLQALGLNEGIMVKVLNRKNRGALIIKVRGTRLALGKHIAKGIAVEEVASCQK